MIMINLVGWSSIWAISTMTALASWQWERSAMTTVVRHDRVDLVDGPDVIGANEAELTIIAGFNDIGLYDCVVTDALEQAVSDPAVLGIRTSCPGDVNQDGFVSFRDIDAFVQLMNTACP